TGDRDGAAAVDGRTAVGNRDAAPGDLPGALPVLPQRRFCSLWQWDAVQDHASGCYALYIAPTKGDRANDNVASRGRRIPADLVRFRPLLCGRSRRRLVLRFLPCLTALIAATPAAALEAPVIGLTAAAAPAAAAATTTPSATAAMIPAVACVVSRWAR